MIRPAVLSSFVSNAVSKSGRRHVVMTKSYLGGGIGNSSSPHCTSRMMMGTIADNVSFDTIAREWRCKWSPDNNKDSLQSAQTVLDDYLDEIKGTAGIQSVHRIVCGGNLDFKIIVALDEVEFKSWSDVGFPPEEALLDKLRTIDGITNVETQTYTFMEV